MSPRSKPSPSSTHTQALLRGIILGLAFFIPILAVVKNAATIRTWMDGLSTLPVVNSISRDFKTGLDVSGELFKEKSDLFYQSDTSLIWSIEKNELTIPETEYAWHRQDLEAKLNQKFGHRKMNGAHRFLDYIERYRSLAIQEMIYSHIPASIKLAQGILESDAGKSYLARSTNNHFGIKCLKKKGSMRDGLLTDSDFSHNRMAIDCFQQTDDHEWDRFEVYTNIADSYRRHTNLLTQSKRYNWMIDAYHTGIDYKVSKKWFGKETVPYYAAWTIGLKESGYATSKRYAQKVAYIIETYELWRIDYSVVSAVP